MTRNLVGALAILVCTAVAAATSSPYAGEQGRAIKALSEEQVADLLAGRGMGFAKAAELNGYPGARHVIDLADQLALSDDQLRGTRRLFDSMQEQAIDLGRQVIDAERQLDELFLTRRASPATLSAAVARIGTLQAELRRVHLQAHIDTTALLSDAQLAKYSQLRGYGAAPVKPDHQQHEH